MSRSDRERLRAAGSGRARVVHLTLRAAPDVAVRALAKRCQACGWMIEDGGK